MRWLKWCRVALVASATCSAYAACADETNVVATVTFNNGNGAVVYDGQGYGVEAAVTDPAEGAAVLFALGDSSGPTNTWSPTAPMFTNACKETVWVELSAVGYKTVTNSVAVVIEPRDIAEASVSSVPPRTYQYVPLQPEPASVQYNGLQLAAAVDYTLSWVSNDAPGTAAVLLVGQGNYKGTNRQEFAILPTVTASLKWKYAKDENGRFYAQVAIPWYAGYNDAISNMRLLFDDRYYKYGASLDEEQTAFFRISSMMDMKDENGNLYYMNAKTGDIYTEEFLQSGYKEVLRAGAAMGDPNYLNGKQVGTSSTFASNKPTHYFDEQGALNSEGEGFKETVTVDGQYLEVKLSTTQGQLVASLVDPVTQADSPWATEPDVNYFITNRFYRAVPIEISSFATLGGGERAAFGVSDMTMTNAPASVPPDERKICLKIVGRDVTAREAVDDTNALLVWNEDGETCKFPLLAEVPWPTISNVATTQRVDGVIGVDFSFDVANSPELFCEEGIQPVFCISVMDNATGSNFVASAEALSGDVGTEAGSHIVTWDMDAQGFYLLPTNFTFWVSYVKNPVGTVFDPAGDAIGESFAWRPQSGFFSSMFTGVAIKPPPPVVFNVVARQRWPWNGLVDVDYDVDVRTTDVLVEIDIDEQGGQNRHWVATNFLAGAEPALNKGHNRATWDTKADGVKNIVADVVATVKLVNSLSVTSAASAPIDLSNGIDHLTVQELAAAMIHVEDGIASAQAAINDSVEERTDVEAQLQAVENTYNNAGYNNTDLAQLEQDVKDLMVQEADARRAVADNKKNLTESNYYQNYARPLAKAIIKYYLVYTGEVSVADLDKVDIGEWFNQGYYDKHFCVRYLNNEGMPQERFFDFVTCDAAGNPLIKESLSDKFDDTPSNVTGIVVLEKTPTYAFHEAGDNTKPVVVEDTTENRATYKAQTKAATMKYRDVGGNHYIISQRTGWGTATAEDSVKGALKIDLNAGKEAVELSKIIQDLTDEIQEINSKIDLANARINELTALRPAIEGRLAYLMSIATDEESSEAFRLDTREGARESVGAETLTYSCFWDGNPNSVVVISQATDTIYATNGVLVAGLAGEDVWNWSVQYDGIYTLTHATVTDGVTGKVETATFVVRGLGSPVADLTAEIAWKLLEATGTYFAQLKVTCTNEILVGIDDLKFVFADRVGADGKNEAVLWNTPARSANSNTMTAAGKEYRFVALDPALITAENTPVVYGVSNMSASSIPVNERTIEMYVRRRVNPQAGNESAANVDNFVGYVVWSSGGENLSLPVAAGAVGRALGAAGLSTASNTATLPSPKRLNTALAVGVMPEEDGEPYCKFSEFSVDGDTIRGKIEVGADGQAGRVGENARLVLLGGDSPGGALADLCTVDVGSDGSFSVPAPKDARFFKLALEIGEVAE